MCQERCNIIKERVVLKKTKRIIKGIANFLLKSAERLAYWRFYNYPFGNSPRGNAKTYERIWNETKIKEYAIIDQYEAELGYSIDKNWFHELALLTQVVIKKSDICYQHGRLLYLAPSFYVSQNSYRSLNILETGTARGFSSLCIAKALHDAGQPGKIVTFDVLPHDVKMYWNCVADEKGPQTRSELLHDYKQLIEEFIIFHQGDSKIELKKVQMPRVHFAFLDGAHTYECILNEFNFIKDKQLSGDMIFFDDYTPAFFPEIVKAVDKICEDNDYSKKVVTLSEQRGYVIAQKN